MGNCVFFAIYVHQRKMLEEAEIRKECFAKMPKLHNHLVGMLESKLGMLVNSLKDQRIDKMLEKEDKMMQMNLLKDQLLGVTKNAEEVKQKIVDLKILEEEIRKIEEEI